jgi:prevent-host-death family protein
MQGNIVGLKEFRENVESFAKKVKRGDSLIVVKRSRPLFKIVPLEYEDDEGQWETVIDFTKINPRGVPIEQIIKALKDGQSKKGHRKAAKKISGRV